MLRGDSGRFGAGIGRSGSSSCTKSRLATSESPPIWPQSRRSITGVHIRQVWAGGGPATDRGRAAQPRAAGGRPSSRPAASSGRAAEPGPEQCARPRRFPVRRGLEGLAARVLAARPGRRKQPSGCPPPRAVANPQARNAILLAPFDATDPRNVSSISTRFRVRPRDVRPLTKQNICSIIGHGLRRAPLPHQLLVPRRRLGGRRARRAGPRAGPERPGSHRPQRAVRGRPIRLGGARGGPPAGDRGRDRAPRSVRPGPGPHRRPGPPLSTPGHGSSSGRRAAGHHGTGRSDSERGPAVAAPSRADSPARPARTGQGGPARNRRRVARAPPRPARPRRDRLSEPVPPDQSGPTWPAPRACPASPRRCSPITSKG